VPVRAASPRGSPERAGSTLVVVTAIFLVLGLSVAALVKIYRVRVLEPRLRGEAVANAEVLARSQGNLIASALRSGSDAERTRALSSTLDELLLLRDPASKLEYFDGVRLEVDYAAVAAPAGTLDMRKENSAASGTGFAVDAAIYDPETYALLAVAHFRVSDRFFAHLSRDVRTGSRGS